MFIYYSNFTPFRVRSGALLWWDDPYQADFRGAFLPYSTFCDMDLSGVDFQYAILWEADFRDSSLQDANFFKADLRNVEFGGSKVRGAIFDEAVWLYPSQREQIMAAARGE